MECVKNLIHMINEKLRVIECKSKYSDSDCNLMIVVCVKESEKYFYTL